MERKLNNLIETIKRIKRNNQFKNYIDSIQFPFFKNLETDQKITFDFPFTAFIGPNGSGKSSTLHALYGCPEGKTPYDFWFSTSLDPIEYYSSDGRRLRQSFFYTYKGRGGEELEVIKARIKRKNNPDYWETSRPLLGAGMKILPEGKRNEPIKKKVVYLDFRSELSAFDKYFYYEMPPANLRARTQQDYLRNRSVKLKTLFEDKNKIITIKGRDQNKEVIELSNEEIQGISEILGREYSACKIIYHKLFHNWGYSILLRTGFFNYSEAFAGSGEMSIVRLVKEVLNAENESLILLDEPEVSLHPGAQNKLKYFLLDQILKKKHQIIISTHSPTLIEGLPKEAIKVFNQRKDTGKVIVKDKILPEEAFYFIGQEVQNIITFFVEDILAKKIIIKVLQKLGDEVANRFKVEFIPGGANTVITKYIPIYSKTAKNTTYFILDGDQKPQKEPFDTKTVQAQQRTTEFLEDIIKEQTGCKIQFYVDGNDEGGNKDQKVDVMIEFLNYYKNNVYFLPKNIPEDIIWNEDEVKNMMKPDEFENNIQIIRRLKNNKQKIFESAKIIFDNENQVDALEDRLIKEWLAREDESFTEIKDIIQSMS